MPTRLWSDLGYGMAAAAAAMLAMAAAAGAGVGLLGAGQYGPTGPLAAAGVVLAAGGRLDLSLGVAGSPVPLDGYGVLALRPLGVGLAGAVAFGAVLLLPLRRRAVPPARLAVRAAAAGGGFVTLTALAAARARGQVTLPAPGEEAGSGPVPGADSTAPDLVVGFTPDLTATLAGAVVWVLLVLAGCWLGSSRVPVPAGVLGWHDRLRPVATAIAAAAAAGVAVIVAGAAVATVGGGNPAVLGGALLGGPTVLVVLVTVGLGARWSAGLAGTGQHGTPSFGELSLGELSAEAGLVGWLVPVGTATLFLLACGVLAARGPVPGGGRGRGAVLRAGTLRAGTLAAALGVAMPVLAALAHITVRGGLSVFGAELAPVEAELRTSLLLAAVLGAGGGAVAGFLGSVAVSTVRATRRPARSYARQR